MDTCNKENVKKEADVDERVHLNQQKEAKGSQKQIIRKRHWEGQFCNKLVSNEVIFVLYEKAEIHKYR